MRAVAAAAVAVVVLGSAACSPNNAKTSDPAKSALSSATSAAASVGSDATSAAASVASDASSAAASVASDASTAAASAAESLSSSAMSPHAAVSPPASFGERPADNTVRLVIGSYAPKVYTPQSCTTIPGAELLAFAGQADGGGQLVISATAMTKAMVTVLGGEAKFGSGESSDLVVNPDGTFYGTAKFIDTPVTFYGHCDAIKAK